MTTLLQNSLSTTTPIAQECLRLLAALLRTCPEWAPTTAQLRFLISWSLTDIEEAAAQVAAFALLRGVIKRRLVVPEVYDVMGKVEDLMIRSQVGSGFFLERSSSVACQHVDHLLWQTVCLHIACLNGLFDCLSMPDYAIDIVDIW